jgi:hypothetical protein
MSIIQIFFSLILACVLVLASATQAWAFCGFYVGGANANLFNKASQVIIARDGNNTILTMANDYQGDIDKFAMVVPVPVAIKREQVNVGKRTTVEKLDAFSQPRLVEYFDPDPCNSPAREDTARMESSEQSAMPRASAPRRRGDDGVTVEDSFKVNEYEIVILSAKESDGLERWLGKNGYNIPKGAAPLLQPYIKQQMKFFVAKIDLKEFDKSGYKLLRPLQIAYESPKFVLPLRLGMINSRGEQDLIIYALSPKGRIETTNYRSVSIPTDRNIPEFVKNEFGKFYQDTFQRSYERENKKVTFLEYAWDVSNCDPCSTTPPNNQELKEAGVFWLDNNSNSGVIAPSPRQRRPISSSTFITRIHVRYTRDKFPEDLMFQETNDRSNFQGRYVMNHPFKGSLECSAGKEYQQKLRPRLEKEAGTLANLTGWSIRDIYSKIDFSIAQPKKTTQPTNDKKSNDTFWRSVW